MKRCYIITFDLKNPGINQDNLVGSIKSAQSWARLGSNSFLILSNLESVSIRTNLLKHIYQGDKLYVGKLDNSAAWFGLDNDVSNWIRNNQK